jgi:hypothetical protein
MISAADPSGPQMMRKLVLFERLYPETPDGVRSFRYRRLTRYHIVVQPLANARPTWGERHGTTEVPAIDA